MVTRAEGYRNSQGIEQIVSQVFHAFASEALEWNLTDIRDPEQNYLRGDYCLPSGKFIECKGQPIDPNRYPQNFVEVFERTSNPRHLGGQEALSSLLGQTLPALQAAKVYNAKSKTREVLGQIDCLSISIRSIFSAEFTGYVNYSDGGRFVYLYTQEEISRHVMATSLNGFLRGAGRSNEDTYAVLIPLSRHRWVRERPGWSYCGDGAQEEIVALSAAKEAPKA